MNREDWLLKAAERIAVNLFEPNGYKVPRLRISVGIPYGSKGLKAIGQHWSPKASDDGIGTVFVSPIIADASRALDILVHELVHATVGVEQGHNQVFKRCAVLVGLTGKMTHTTASEALNTYLAGLISDLGAYPHAKLNIGDRIVEIPVDPLNPDGPKKPGTTLPWKKQGTRMIKQSCKPCGYIVRSSQSSIDKHGSVVCPCGEPMKVGV